MIASLHTGRLPQLDAGIASCDRGRAALLVTVCDAETCQELADTEVRVRCAAADLNAVVRTDQSGRVTVAFEQLDALEVSPGPVVVSDPDETTDSYRFECPTLSAEGWRSATAYFGAIYRLELVWAGAAIGAAAYRAVYELREGETALTPGSTLRGDGAYRLVIADPHSLEDVSDKGLLGARGDVTSKPADYAANNWLPSVSPAMPLLVRVTKRRNEQELEVGPDDRLRLRCRVLDPPADFGPEGRAMNPARPIAWLQAVHALYRPDDQGDWEGNKNCPKAFGGAREDKGRIKAPSVLRHADGSPLAGAPEDDHLGEAPVTETEGNAGVVQLYFCPPPIAGDSYELDLRLQRAGVDHYVEQGGMMRSWVNCGRIELWLRVRFRLFAGVSGVSLDDFRWPEIQDAYAAAYVEIDRHAPVQQELSEYGTQESITSVFPWNGITPYDYKPDYLLPGYVVQNYPTHWASQIDEVTRAMIGRLAISNGLEDPNGVRGSDGLHLLLSKLVYANCDIAGEYIGRGQFFMVQLHDFHETLAHELGHALYLRHGLTSHQTRLKPEDGWNGPATTKCEVVPLDNWYDHDPADSVACLMSYNNSYFDDEVTTRVAWHFCGGCLLKLRFWDTVALAADPAYRELMDDTLAPLGSELVLVKDARVTHCKTVECPRCLSLERADLVGAEAGSDLPLRALLRPDPQQSQWSRDCWIDIARHPGAVWASANDEVVAIQQGRITIPPRHDAPPPVRLELRFGQVSGHLEVQVGGPAESLLQQLHPRRLRCTPVGDPGGRQACEVDTLRLKAWDAEAGEALDLCVAMNGERFFWTTDPAFAEPEGLGKGLELKAPPLEHSGIGEPASEYADYLAVTVSGKEFEVVYNHHYGDTATVSELRYLDWDGHVWSARFV